MNKSKKHKRQNKRFSIRKKIFGTEKNPRLAVFRSNKEIYAQLIDDVQGFTLVIASSRDEDLKKIEGTKVEKAKKVGELLADRAKNIGVQSVIFDRGGFLYHGRVKALAEGAREGGLKF
ncbi:MAG: 50S ribosomal protein L18 [Bacteroidota bacterium]|nr:50S ribosomal protein L18 [Bacteroidota bacterium]